MSEIKSTAGSVLRDPDQDAESKSLAAYVLGDAAPARTARSLSDLRSLLTKVEGVEGQTERVAAIRAEIARG